MSSTWRRRAGMTAGIVAVMVLSGCASGHHDAASGSGSGSLTILMTNRVVSNDPSLTDMDSSASFFYAIYDNLYSFNDKGEVIPEVATGDVTSADGLTQTITIRSGIKFQNGDDLTSEDVKFSLERAIDPNRKVPLAGDLSSISSVTTDGDTKVVVHLKAPTPTLPNILAGPTSMIVPEKYIEKVGEADFVKNPIGSGPFKFESVTQGGLVNKLVANPNYWKGAPKLSSVTFQTVTETATQISLLTSGQADLILAADPTQVGSMDPDKFKLIEHPSGEVQFIQIRIEKKPFDDPRVRQALNYAINKDAIVKNVFKGDAVELGTLSAPGWEAYDPSIKPYPYDPAKAKELLKEAGVTGDLSIGLAMPSNRWPGAVTAAQAMVSDWKAVGINVDLQLMDYQQWLKALGTGQDSTVLPMLTMTNSLNREDDAMAQLSGQTSCKPYSRLCVQKYDDVMNKAKVTSGDERATLIKQLDQMWHDDAAFVFLWSPEPVFAMGKGVNVTLTEGSSVLYDLETATNTTSS